MQFLRLAGDRVASEGDAFEVEEVLVGGCVGLTALVLDLLALYFLFFLSHHLLFYFYF